VRQVIFPAAKKTAFCITLIIFAMSVMTCANIRVHDSGAKDTMTAKTIERVLKEHTDEWMSIPGVVGTAQGLCGDKPCIKVFVIEKTLELKEKIPAVLEDYQVMVEAIGEVRALPKNQP
jgi:hypothetical protein